MQFPDKSVAESPTPGHFTELCLFISLAAFSQNEEASISLGTDSCGRAWSRQFADSFSIVLAECGLSSQAGHCLASCGLTIATLWHGVIFISTMG